MINKLKLKNEFSRNVLTLMTGTIIAQAIPVAISPILTRIYTPEEFGIFAVFIAIVSIFASVITGRYEVALMLPKKDEDAINIFTLGLIITTVMSIVLLCFIIIFYDVLISFNKEIGVWLYFVPMAVFFVGIYTLLTYFNNRKKYYKDLSHASIVKSVVMVIVQISVGLIKQGADGLIGGQIMSNMMANSKLIKNIYKNKILLGSISIVKIVALAKKYKNFPKFQVPHAFVNSFSSNIPIYMFSMFFSTTIVGYYALSTRIVLLPLTILSGASAKVYNQKVSELYYQGGDSYGFTIRVLKSLFKKIIFPFLLIIIFAPDIFAFIFGEAWREAGVYTQILAPWLLMVFFVSTISFVSSMLHLQKKALVIEVIYSLLRVVAILIGIYYKNVYLGLVLFSIAGFAMVGYNMIWMLSSLKKAN